MARDFYELWLEYDLQSSYEAKVVKSLDKLEALLQVIQYRGGQYFPKHLEFNASYAMKGSDIDPALAEFGNLLITEMKKNYKEFKKDSI